MKSIYIPKGESRSYEYLITDDLVVDGHLNVVHGVKATHISGRGVITAGTVNADVITAEEIETATIVCRRLMAKRVSAAEVYASDSAAVSCFLSAAYVETGKLTTAISEIDELKADEIIHLAPNKHGMVLTLLLSALRSLWATLTAAFEKAEDADYRSDANHSGNGKTTGADGDKDHALCEEIAKTVREIMQEQAARQAESEEDDTDDFELKRIISTFKLLRKQGYTLRVEPGTPEENAPVYDLEKSELFRPAA